MNKQLNYIINLFLFLEVNNQSIEKHQCFQTPKLAHPHQQIRKQFKPISRVSK